MTEWPLNPCIGMICGNFTALFYFTYDTVCNMLTFFAQNVIFFIVKDDFESAGK